MNYSDAVLFAMGGSAVASGVVVFLSKLFLASTFKRIEEEHKSKLTEEQQSHKSKLDKAQALYASELKADSDKKLEAYKASLEKETIRLQVSYGGIYEKQATAINSLYQGLIELYDMSHQSIHAEWTLVEKRSRCQVVSKMHSGNLN